MSLLLGVTAAFGWGAATFFGRFTSRSVGAMSGVLFSQTMGLIFMSFYVTASGELTTRAASSHWYGWAWAVLAASIHTFSLVMMFRAAEVGLLSAVAPIAGSYAAITVTLSVLSGESITVVQILGIAVALTGVALAGRKPGAEANEPRRLMQGVPFALAAAAGFGIGYWVMGFRVTPNLGSVVPVWVVRVTSVALLTLYFLLRGKAGRFQFPRGRTWGMIIAGSTCANLAYLANNYGFTFGSVGTVSVLASLNSSVAVMLAWLFLHERLARVQWVGISLVLAGITLLSL